MTLQTGERLSYAELRDAMLMYHRINKGWSPHNIPTAIPVSAGVLAAVQTNNMEFVLHEAYLLTYYGEAERRRLHNAPTLSATVRLALMDRPPEPEVVVTAILNEYTGWDVPRE